MSISIFAVVLLLLIIWRFLFRKKKNLKSDYKELVTITIASSLVVRMGYFMKLGDSAVSYTSVLVYLTAAVAVVILGFHKRVPKRLFTLVCVCFFLLILNAIIFFVFPYKESIIIGDWSNYVLGKNVYGYLDANSLQFGYYLMFFCIGVILCVSKAIFSDNDWIDILREVSLVAKLNVFVGYIELVIRNILHSTLITDIAIILFGSEGVQQNALYSRGGFFSPQGFTKEASMYATVLFYTSILFMISYRINISKKKKREKLWLIATVILLVSTVTLSAIIFLVEIGLIIYSLNLMSAKRKIVKTGKSYRRLFICTISGVVLITILAFNYKSFLNSNNYVLTRIGNAFKSLSDIVKGASLLSSSETIRFSSIVYDFGLLLKRPLLGFGLGTVACNSGILTFLVNGGILLFIVFYLILVEACGIRNKAYAFLIVFEVWMLPSIILGDYETILCLVIPLICALVPVLEKEFGKERIVLGEE